LPNCFSFMNHTLQPIDDRGWIIDILIMMTYFERCRLVHFHQYCLITVLEYHIRKSYWIYIGNHFWFQNQFEYWARYWNHLV